MQAGRQELKTLQNQSSVTMSIPHSFKSLNSWVVGCWSANYSGSGPKNICHALT